MMVATNLTATPELSAQRPEKFAGDERIGTTRMTVKMFHERSAEKHVDDLHAAANAQNGLAARIKFFE